MTKVIFICKIDKYLVNKYVMKAGLMKKLIALVILISGLFVSNTNAQTLGTVITNGMNGVDFFVNPSGVTADAANNYFITVSGGIVKYDTDTGMVYPFCGGYTNPASPTEAAYFLNPQDIVYSKAKSGFFIADAGNHVIVFMDTNGNASVYAGKYREPGLATIAVGTNATFNYPVGLAVDSVSGDLYVADFNNNNIRKVDATTTNVTALFASPSPFYHPAGVAIDEDNNRLFIADTGHHSVWVWTNGAANAFLIAGHGTTYEFGNKISTIGTQALLNAPRGLTWVGQKNGVAGLR